MEFTPKKLDEIKKFAMDALQVKEGKRGHVGRVLDVALDLVIRDLDPAGLTISRERQEMPEKVISASPYASKKDHRQHMIDIYRKSDRH